MIILHHGLGENTDDPGSSATTSTKLADGLICIVSCNDAGFLRVPDTKDVSYGMLLLISTPVRKLNSYNEIGSLFKIFLNRAPDSNADI